MDFASNIIAGVGKLIMGNEMGNNSTSGFKEDNTTVEDPKEVLKETAKDVKEENQVVPAAEDKDFHEKANGLASGDKQTPSEGEQEGSEVLRLVDSSPKVAVKSKEAGDESSENRVSLSSTTQHESLLEPNLEKIVPETSENQLPMQPSVKKEEEGLKNSAFDKISTTPHDPEPEKPAYSEIVQQELTIIHEETSLPDANGSSDGTEQALASILTCASVDNGHLSHTEAGENQEESADTGFSTIDGKKMDEAIVEEKAVEEEIKECCEEKFEPEDGGKFENGSSNVTPLLSGLSGPSEKSDEGSLSELSLTRDVCSESEPEPETVSVTKSLEPCKEAPETEEKYMVGKELENGEYKHENNSSQPCEDIVRESETEDSDAIRSESIAVDQKDAVFPSSDSGRNRDCLEEEAKVAENDEVAASHINNRNVVSEEKRKNSEANVMIVPELGIIPSESSIADCNHKDDESTEKRIVEEGEENMENLYAIEIETEETKTGAENQILVDQAEAVLKSEAVLSENRPIHEEKQESSGEFLTTKASTFASTNLIAEIIVSMNELAVDKAKQDVKQCIERPEVMTSETKISSKTGERLSMGSIERFSTDSEPDNINVQYDQMRKSPSFSLDLQSEAKNEESDRTPLLYQDKAAIQGSPSQDDVSLATPLTLNGYTTQDDQAMPVEDKVVTLERSDSEKSKTPFLGFLKEEEEAHIVVKPQKQIKESTKELRRSSSTKETTSSTPTKGKNKPKARSSLFGNCLCCATVIN
ncbi:hypothetical protein TIFTF001_015971 [Ficus carica]|uniref:Uncharacterized protein n=1 Tax=Ficus carica TaxID=3494 RepID=A0AA88D9G7_FICCA|nr:hypothetical protein TIFTF001_015971 [Ficus carica]